MQHSILNTTVSVFHDYNSPDGPQPVNLLSWLTSDKHAEKVAAIRREADKKVRDTIKATLPAITPSGTFTYRAARCLMQHSGFIQFDIDAKENEHIGNYQNLKAEICKIVNVAYCGLSVSGTGFWGLIPIAHSDKHRQHFDFIFNAFKNLGITIDKKPRNVAALRGYSYDADAYFNHNAQPLTQYHQPQAKATKTYYTGAGDTTRQQVETLINELTKRGTDITATYDDWCSLAFAFVHEFGEGGRQYFHDVSGSHAGYDRTETDDQYSKCLNAAPSAKPITIKSFFRPVQGCRCITATAGGSAQKKRFPFPSP